LTLQGFPNYSASMDADLKSLEAKLTKLIELTQNLRTENAALRQELVQAQSESKKLRENVDVVSSRLEAIIERLPEESV
jgi:cell division protein ZapB